jgi:pyrimidine-nucleoside phosphorylase
MRMYDVIEKKKHGMVLTDEEIHFFVDGFTKGTVPDYQLSALLMAIYFQGMNKEETNQLTLAMAKSGDMLDLSSIHGVKVDKHSTGGVGDKTSLVLAPLIASLGVPVAKMSGRGLGHTGGTIDKLDSFKGFTTNLSEADFIKNVNEISIAIAGQTANLAPADKKLYALRDVTATVDNISLIASSIMSKKIASGADCIVLDVKCGSGAFMKTAEEATPLARAMVDIGNGLGRKTSAVISDMNQPLGFAVGNALEVIEAINTLKGNGPDDLRDLCLELGSQMLLAAKRVDPIEDGKELLQ